MVSPFPRLSWGGLTSSSLSPEPFHVIFFPGLQGCSGLKGVCLPRMCLQPCNLLDFSTVASIEAWAQRVVTMWSTPVLRMCCCISYPPRTARYTFPGQEVGQAARRACVQRLFEAGRIPKAVCVRFSLLYKVSRTRIPLGTHGDLRRLVRVSSQCINFNYCVGCVGKEVLRPTLPTHSHYTF